MKFVRKDSRVEAMQWNGNNTNEIVIWLQGGWQNGGIWLKQKVEGPLEFGRAIDPACATWSLIIPRRLSLPDVSPPMIAYKGGKDGDDGEEIELFKDQWVVIRYNSIHDRNEVTIFAPDDFEKIYEPV